MRKTPFFIIPLVVAVNIVGLSCSLASIFQPTSTATPTATNTPTSSPTLTATATLLPSPTIKPTSTPTFTPTISLPSGTPLKIWHHIPIMPGATAGEVFGEDWGYDYITQTNQDDVRDFYIEQLPIHNWAIDFISPNDNGGYIIYRQSILDFIYIFEDGNLTHVEIFLSPNSPSRNP